MVNSLPRVPLPRYSAFYPTTQLEVLRGYGFDTLEGSKGWGWIAWTHTKNLSIMVKEFEEAGIIWEGRKEWGARFVRDPLPNVPAESAALAHPYGQQVWLAQNQPSSCVNPMPCGRCKGIGMICLLPSPTAERCWPCWVIKRACGPEIVRNFRESKLKPERDVTTLEFTDRRFQMAWDLVLDKVGLYVNRSAFLRILTLLQKARRYGDKRNNWLGAPKAEA
jgi:hypothetical protein